MLPILSSEFKWKSFTFSHPHPQLFVVSKWQDKSVSKSWYVFYRWFWAIYHMTWCTICFLNEGGFKSTLNRKLFYFIYLTQWSYMVLTLMNLIWAIVVTGSHFEFLREKFLPKQMTLKLRLVWFLVNLTFLPAFLITAVYWSAVYDPAFPIGATNVETHIINTVYVIIELTISAIPIRILHFYQPMFYLCIYALFNFIYFLAGGLTPYGDSAIYPIMDWENVRTTLPALAILMIFTPVVQVTVWAVSISTKKLAKLIKKETKSMELTLSSPSIDSTLHV